MVCVIANSYSLYMYVVCGGSAVSYYNVCLLLQALPDNVERGKGGTDGPPPFTPFKKVVGSSEQREIVSHSRSMKETDSHSMKETDSHSRSMKETDSHSRSTKETDSHSRSMKETDSHSREPGNRPLQDAREEKKQVSKRNPSEAKPSRFHDGDGSKPQWKNDDNIQRRGAAQQRGYSSLDPERSQQKESRSYETARNQEGRHGYDSQPNLQHKEGRRGRWSRDRKGEEEGDDMVHGKPKSTYQLSDWLDQKLKINQKPSTLPEPVEEDDLALRLAIAESMRMYREESQEDGIGQAEKRTASTDDDFESRDDDFRSRDDHFRSRSDHFGRRDGSKEGSWRRERNEGGHERRPNLGHHGYTRDRGYQRHEQPRRQDWQGHEERSRWQGHEENSRWQGHEENSRWQGHEEKPRWQGHEENSRWQGHEEKPRWQGHEENSRWQGHEENSRWQGHEERSRWQRHEERSRWQGHNEEKSRWQGHEEKSRWQGHNEEKSRWQGHNEEKSRWQGHNEEKSRWQGHEEKSRWQGHNEERSRWQSNPRWSNNDPYQQTERRGKVGNHGDRPTKSQTDWAKEEAGRGRGPHQQAKGHSTHGDRPTQDVKHRDDFSRTPGDVEKPTGKRAAGLKTVDQQQPPLKEEEYNWDWVNKGVPSTASRNNS